MRVAEDRAIAAGTSVETLMERAGAAVAEAAWRFGGGRPVLVLCGPGNNGGDGYVAARLLDERGASARVAATGEPRTVAAKAARARWTGPVEALGGNYAAPVLVDALYGTGLTRPLDLATQAALVTAHVAAQLSIAVDLPSGLATDDGAPLNFVPVFDITLALGALKPAHRLLDGAAVCGTVLVADIGVECTSLWSELARPKLSEPRASDHKYSRGLVVVIGADMPGAGRLAATAAARAGAGMVRLYGDAGGPDAIVARSRDALAEELDDERIGAVVLGPGLADAADAARLLALVRATKHPLVLDAGAARAAKGIELAEAILTPHEGEFVATFGRLPGSKIERALAATTSSRATIVLKGADTVIASPDGRVAVAPPSSTWLSTAGTGDVLAGMIGAMRARGLGGFDAACAGVWLHGEAARRAGPTFIADDLPAHVSGAIEACL